MAIIHEGQVISDKENILLSKWKDGNVFGEYQAEKPKMCIFNNTRYAAQMLNKHLVNNELIAFHTDVDVDGIGTTYVFKKTLENISTTRHLLMINKDKIHGIQQKHVEYFKHRPLDLLIITDSSCNEIEIIKQFNCDVLVIDHHDLLHNDLRGKCNDGVHDYVIMNNTIDNTEFNEDLLWLKSKNISAFDDVEEYKGTKAMSCGLVVYEFLRVYCSCFSNPKILENLMLYQWAGVTLMTDVIDTINSRNQWYLDNTFFVNDVEPSLRIMLSQLNKFKGKLDKSYINYTFAPMINKAIRAGAGAKALDIVLKNPADIGSLSVYAKMQDEAIQKATMICIDDPDTNSTKLVKREFNGETIQLDISKLNIHKNYTGVIAGRLSGSNNKNAAVYITTDNGNVKGSFRGRYKNIAYREFFDSSYPETMYAQGHDGAFGFECTQEQLNNIMNNIKSIEPINGIKPFITIGDFDEKDRGEYHVDSLDEFRKQGYLLRIATGNAKVTSNDEITIKVKTNDIVLKDKRGKMFIYSIMGIECLAFEALSGSVHDIYPEFTNGISMYIK